MYRKIKKNNIRHSYFYGFNSVNDEAFFKLTGLQKINETTMQLISILSDENINYVNTSLYH